MKRLMLSLCLLTVFASARSINSAGDIRAAAIQDNPTIVKDSVIVWARKVSVYKGDFDTWSWVPRISFRVNGPIPSGGQLYVEFGMPGAPSWVKIDCPTDQIEKGYWWNSKCGGSDIPDEKGTTYTGPVSFSIKMRNELAGSDMTIFSGKMKVAKVHSNEVGPHAANRFIYYVDHDWTLPIGYVYLKGDDVYGMKKPTFNAAFWVRGDAVNVDPHLFYKGKDVSRLMWQGELIGKPSCGGDEDGETGTMSDIDDAKKIIWTRVTCTFPVIKGWDKSGEEPSTFGSMHNLADNPGDYEIKILWKNRLSRSIKFTVTPDGKFDNGISAANKLGRDRVIVPVQILGDQDGIWDKTSWKTESYFGNPITGFTWP